MSTSKIAVTAVTVVLGTMAVIGTRALRRRLKKTHSLESSTQAPEIPGVQPEHELRPIHIHSEAEVELMEIFESKCLDRDVHLVEFDPAWANGTGYYDGACYAELPEIEPGGWFFCVDHSTNRRIIGKKLTHGKNIVVFERYTYDDTNMFVLVSNCPDGVTVKGFVSSIKKADLERFFSN